MKITFIGIGYVGLVSGVMMSYLGHDVTCIDVDESKIADVKQNILPIYEPELHYYLKHAISNNKIKFTTKYTKELEQSEAIFVTVGTPDLGSGDADLSYILAAVENIAKMTNNGMIVIKSTVPPGTCDNLQVHLQKKTNLKIASNPEFLREGGAIYDFLNPCRIVFGTSDLQSEEILKTIYKPLIDEGTPIVNTNLITAELIKYASNAYLATKLAFINEIADLSEKVSADIEKLTLGVGLDNRIGSEFLKPGPGFGGSCFPKDINALANFAKTQKNDFLVLNAVIQSNYKRPYTLSKKIIHLLGGNVLSKNITILGLSFKAGTDDVRSSPAIEITKLLKDAGAIITVFDPKAMENAAKILPQDINYATSVNSSYLGSDALIIATEWAEFKNLDFDKLYEQLSTKIIIDLRNLLPIQELIQKGFKCYAIGNLCPDYHSK